MDPDLLEDLGFDSGRSSDARDLLNESLKKVFSVFTREKEEDVAKLRVRVTKTTVFYGQGRALTGGTEFDIPERDFEKVKAQCRGNLEKVTDPVPKKTRDMKAGEAVTKKD